MIDLAPSRPAQTGLDPGRLHDACRAIGAFLVRAGLRPHGPAILPEQEAAITALAIIVAGAADGEDAVPRFLELIVPVIAKTPDEIAALLGFAQSEEGQALTRALFAQRATIASPPLSPAAHETADAAAGRASVARDGATPSAAGLRVADRAALPAPSLPGTFVDTLARLLGSAIGASRRLLGELGAQARRIIALVRGDARRARLVRRSLADLGPQFSLILAATDASGASPARQRHTAITLAAWEDAGWGRLDVPRTVNATIARGGLFRPAWRRARRASEYLFLVQGLGLRDIEQARLQLVFGQLSDAGARIACYFYLSDPRQLRDFSGAGDGTFHTIDLATVVDRHPYSRLVVVSTGHELVHPFSGKPMDWTRALDAWPQRHLLTPLPETAWSAVERALSDKLRFAVRPASRKSLIEISAGTHAAGAPPEPAGDGMAGIVGISDLRYLTGFAPSADEQTKLIERLRAFLGERGFEWLALCACYPELDLGLTQHLHGLLPGGADRDADEDLLARLTSLAWFRHGFLPTWLRRRIIAELPRAARLAMRRAVADMLSAARFADRPQARAGAVVLPVRQAPGAAARGAQFDGVTVDFLVDGPTRDIDPLVRIGAQTRGESPPATEARPAAPAGEPAAEPAVPQPEQRSGGADTSVPPRAPAPAKPRRLTVFVSGPGDVMAERRRALLVIEKLSRLFSRFITLEAFLWEHEPALAAGRSQDAAPAPGDVDIFVLILWSRLGTALPVKTPEREYRGIDGREPVTAVEWEFEQALLANRETGKPDILAFRKGAPPSVPVDDRAAHAQLQKNLDAVDEFRRRHFVAKDGTLSLAFNEFDTTAAFEEQFERGLRTLIERNIRDVQAAAPPTWHGNPYRGLQAYGIEHAPIFFGRDEAIARAIEQIADGSEAGKAFLVITGSSGSGKSSLVNAGIAPRLMQQRGLVRGAAFLRYAVFRPRAGNTLMVDLVETLRQDRDGRPDLPELAPVPPRDALLGGQDPEVCAALIGGALARVNEDARRRGELLAHETAKLILVIDPLDDLFLDPGIQPAERAAFMQLLDILARSERVWLFVTIRGDIWGRAQETSEFFRLSDRARFALGPPRRDEIIEIIRRPAEAAGLTLAGGLDATLAADAGDAPGVLPLLSFTLETLYEVTRSRGETVLSLEAYQAIGGLRGAMVRRADEVLASLPTNVQAALPDVLYALVAVSDETQRLTGRPFGSFSASERQLIEAFVAARLAVIGADDRATAPTPDAVVRLAHEVLITHWPRAGAILAESREHLVSKAFLELQHRRWEAAGRARDRLLRGADLRDAIGLRKRWGDKLGPDLLDYIDQSRRARRWPFWRR